MWWNLSEHLFQLFFMVTIVLGSQAISRRAQRERVHDEARRLRVALSINLKALRNLYQDNSDSLRGGRLPLISSRNHINLLRTQLARLTSLDSPEIEAVMTANIAAERAETGMAIAGKKVEGVAFTIPADAAARAILMTTLRETCSALAAAEDLLNPPAMPGREALSAVPSVRGLAAA
jgi:hypothetical protein